MNISEMYKKYYNEVRCHEEEYIINSCKKLLKLGKFKRHKDWLSFYYTGNAKLFIRNIEYNKKDKDLTISYFSKDLEELDFMQFGDVGPNNNGNALLFIKDEEILNLYNTAQTRDEILNDNIKKFIFNDNTKIKLITNENDNSIILEQENNKEYFEIKIYDIKSILIKDFKVTVTYYDINQDKLLDLKKEIYDLTKVIDIKEYVKFLSKYL